MSNPFLDKIIIIQQRYKIKRIKQFINTYSLKNLDIECSKLDYDNFINKMVNKDILQKINIFMLRINRYLNPETKSVPRIFSRNFLSIYLIKYHLDKVLTTVDNKHILHKHCVHFIDFINLEYYTHYSLNKFGVLFNKFCYDYNILLELDKIGLISQAYRHYYDLKTVKNFVYNSVKYPTEQKLDVIKQIDNDIKKVKESVIMVDKKYTDNFLELELVEKEIKEKLNDTYWDSLFDELENEDYSHLIRLINELKEIIILLHPENKRDIFRKQFDEIVIVEEIKNISEEDIQNIINFIFYSITDLQASIRDNETNTKWNQIDEYKNISLNRYVILCIKEFYSMIEKIKMDILLLPYMIESMHYS